MKFSIIAECEKGIIRIPLTSREVSALQDLPFWFEDSDWKNFRLNKMEKEMKSVCNKFTFLGFDVKDDGRFYGEVNGKFGLLAKRSYLIRKPRWMRA